MEFSQPKWPNLMLNPVQTYQRFIGYTPALLLSLTGALASQALPTPSNVLAQFPTQEQITLKAGNVFLTGENGHYIGRILVTAPMDTAWNVVTDYNHFKDFLPGVVSSHILAAQGNRIVFEQINVVKLLLFSQKSRLVVIADKQYPRQIDFRLKEGEIKSLNGIWKLDAISSSQVLITQDVSFDPGNSAPRGLAFNIYKNALVASLKAIRQETERRFAHR